MENRGTEIFEKNREVIAVGCVCLTLLVHQLARPGLGEDSPAIDEAAVATVKTIELGGSDRPLVDALAFYGANVDPAELEARLASGWINRQARAVPHADPIPPLVEIGREHGVRVTPYHFDSRERALAYVVEQLELGHPVVVALADEAIAVDGYRRTSEATIELHTGDRWVHPDQWSDRPHHWRDTGFAVVTFARATVDRQLSSPATIWRAHAERTLGQGQNRGDGTLGIRILASEIERGEVEPEVAQSVASDARTARRALAGWLARSALGDADIEEARDAFARSAETFEEVTHASSRERTVHLLRRAAFFEERAASRLFAASGAHQRMKQATAVVHTGSLEL